MGRAKMNEFKAKAKMYQDLEKRNNQFARLSKKLKAPTLILGSTLANKVIKGAGEKASKFGTTEP